MIRAIIGLKKKLGSNESEHDEGRPHSSVDGGHPSAENDESNWLVSYADMMTLLCGFFIMLFSMATLDEPKFEKVRESLAEQFGGEFHSPSKDLAKWVTQILQETPLKGEADVEQAEGGVAIVFRSQVFFETLSAEVSASGRRVLEELASALREREKFEKKQFRFVIEGHTDARPVLGGGFPTNWELSSARAARVVRVFIDRGFDPARMAAIGYADTRPVAPSRTDQGAWNEASLSQNRRVVVRIFHEKQAQKPTQLAQVGDESEGARAPAATPPEKRVLEELEMARRSAERIRNALSSP